MCGICGFTGRPDRALLKGMLSLMWERGPDEEGVYLNDNDSISLGIRRLSVVDLETGQQPISNEDGTIIVVFNGEIYNHCELRRELISKGHIFKTDHSDTECIVHAFEEYGLDFVHHLNGMFAIAIWDSKKKCLHLFRDRMGVKPLYYAQVGSSLIFASEIKCILACPEIQKMPNLYALRLFFVFRNIPSPMSAFKGIYSLMAGERLSFKNGRYDRFRYYGIDINERLDVSEEEAEAMVRELLEDAVRIRMKADVPVGSFLSGGIDSSIVTALMRHIKGGDVHSFTLGYQDSFPNKDMDVEFAKAMANGLQTSHREHRMFVDELVGEIFNIIGIFDEPFTGVMSTYFLSRFMSRYVKVALSGDGSDELFGGYLPALIAIPLEEHQQSHKGFSDGFLDELWEQGRGDITAVRYHLFVRNGQDPQAFTPDFLSEVSKFQSPKDYFLERFPYNGTSGYLNHMLYIDWNFLLPDQVLKFVDKLSMAHSLEVRSPFLDYRLVEYVFSLNPDIKIKDSKGNIEGKCLLKRSLKGILPDSILYRKKEGFVLPISQWIGEERFFSFLKSVLSPSRINRYKFLDSTKVDKLVRLHEEGRADNSMAIWNIAVFQLWLEKYFPLGCIW